MVMYSVKKLVTTLEAIREALPEEIKDFNIEAHKRACGQLRKLTMGVDAVTTYHVGIYAKTDVDALLATIDRVLTTLEHTSAEVVSDVDLNQSCGCNITALLSPDTATALLPIKKVCICLQ